MCFWFLTQNILKIKRMEFPIVNRYHVDMAIDVLDLREFYETPLGYICLKRIHGVLAKLWPDCHKDALVTLGYSIPYIEKMEHAKAFSFMPAQQGCIPWPKEGASRTVLVEEDSLPLADESVDRLLLIHALEQAHRVRPFLREVWRVLKSNGRAIIVVPNRRSLWAQRDTTPLGHGQPYTMTQLRHLLRDNMFTPVNEMRALYVPPSNSRLLLSTERLWESFGKRFLQKLSGVVCIEVMKQVYAGTPQIRGRRIPVRIQLADA